MTVRMRIRYKQPGPLLARHGAMRREFVYPHRSVRSMRITAGRIVQAAIMAAVMVTLVVMWNADLLRAHNRLNLALLEMSGIPVTDVRVVNLFPGLGPAPVPATSVVRYETHPGQLALMFAAALLVLMAVYRRISLARGIAIFLMILLVVTAAVAALHPSSQFGSVEFAQIWMRGEILVWLLMPFFAAVMFMLVHPVAVVGLGWAVMVQAFGFLWSVVRLAFCIGVMHYSGVLFVPILWFGLGMLADVVYLMVFYSIAIHLLARRAWGRRAL